MLQKRRIILHINARNLVGTLLIWVKLLVQYFSSPRKRMKETRRNCSHCGNSGHSSRWCNRKGCVRLFGVNISGPNQVQSSEERARNPTGNLQSLAEPNAGSLSDDHVHSKRKKVKQYWTREEHQLFLTALKVVGRGNWTRISKYFVPTKTPTQIASHAQKFFIRQALGDKKKCRSSMFDLPFNESASTSSQIVNGPSRPYLDPLIPAAANYSIPRHSGIPYMLRAPAGMSNVPSLRFQAMNYQISACVLRSKASWKPSGIPAPESLPQTTFQARSGPSNEQDPLQLKIGLP